MKTRHGSRLGKLPCALSATLVALAGGCELPHIFPGMGRSDQAEPAPKEPATPPEPEAPALTRAPVASLPLELLADRATKPDPSPQLTATGLQLFETNCATCHGAKGAGNGPAAFMLEPRPRDFTRGIFKLHSNESGSLPTDEDLFDTITRGLPGSAMPAFERLPAEQRWALVEGIKTLAVYKDEDEGTEIHFFKDRPPGPPVALSAPVAASPEVIAQGKAVFQKLECWKCHGNEGKGNGPSSADLKTAWGGATRPRDFEEGRFNGALSLRDIVVRVRTGLGGTPMPAVAPVQASDSDLWALAHYVASLRKGAPLSRPPKGDPLVPTRSAEPIPSDLLQARFWTDVPCYEIALAGDGRQKASVAVQQDGTRLALLVTWEDPIEKTAPAVPDDFLKGVTVELAADKARNEWEWRSEWQRDAANRPGGPFEEGVQGASKLEGCGSWADGRWRVLFVRPLAGGGDRIALHARTLDVVISIADRRSAGTRVSKSATLKLAVR